MERGANITNVGDRKETAPSGTAGDPGEARLPAAAPALNARIQVPILDLSREYRLIGPLLLQAVEEVFSSQKFIMGPQLAQFERAAARKMWRGPRHRLLLWHGCSVVGARRGGHRPGRLRSSLPASAFSPPSAPFCVPEPGRCLVDIDPETFNLDPAAAKACLESASGPTVRALLPVHLYGQIVDWDCFARLKQEYGLLLIEDAAQAFGASWDGRMAGALGDAAAFSFYPTKNLSAAGDAGMVTTVVDAIAERVRLLRIHGMRQRYLHDELGWNCRMDTLQAAVLLVKLGFIDGWNAERRVVAENYRLLFGRAGLVEPGPYPQKGVVLPKTKSKAVHVFHQYVIRVRRRDELKAFLRSRGVESEVYYPLALHQQPALRSLGYPAGSFPQSERAAAEVLALPIFPQLTFQEQELVVAAIADFFS